MSCGCGVMLAVCRLSYVLVVVQELVSYANGSYDPPTEPIDTYSLQELQQATDKYQEVAGGRGQRQEALNTGGNIYIAANLTEEEFMSGFSLGDNEEYGGFSNYPLWPEVFYNLALLATTPGTDIPLFFSSSMPVGQFLLITQQSMLSQCVSVC